MKYITNCTLLIMLALIITNNCFGNNSLSPKITIINNRITIPFVITADTGHQVITVFYNDNKVNLILDTASGVNILDTKTVEQLNIKRKKSESKASGLGTSNYQMQDLSIIKLKFKDDVFIEQDFVEMNLSHVKDAAGDCNMFGLLGSPFFIATEATIDFNKKTLSFDIIQTPIKSIESK